MPFDISEVFQFEQGMEQATSADVKFLRFDLSLADVLLEKRGDEVLAPL